MNTRLLIITSLFSIAFSSNAQVSCPPNVDFEQGNYSNWSFYTGYCCPISTPTFTGPLSNRHVLTSGSGTDIFGGFPVVAPGGGSYSLKLGNNSTGAQAERARYYVHVPNNQNNYSLIYRYAVVFQNPTHTAIEQPRFEVTAYDSATNTIIPCADYSYVATANLPGFALSPLGSQVWYKDWTTASLDLSGLAGKTIAVDFAAGDCSQGGHFGYGYLDMNCALFQIVTVNCNGAPTTSLSAPPGFQSYSWWNSNFTTMVGSGQNVTIPTPAANTQFHVILTPYTGFGCPDTLTTTVNVTSLNVTASNDTVICSGASIPLSVNATSSSNTINYSWAPASAVSCTNCPNPIVTPSANSTYYVTVSDGNGCTETDTVHVALDDVNLTTSSQPAGCSGANGGSATAIPTGGYPPYTYSWSTTPVQTSSTANGLASGTYTVTLMDAKGCTVTATQTVSQVSSPVSVSIASLTHASCQGATNGSASISATGGITPYTYTWNTTPVQTGNTASALSAGSYIVTVTDFQGCNSSLSITITEPPALTATNTTTNLLCPNGNNGSITAVVSGGTAPYTYSWNTTPIQTGVTINNLSAGSYSATITDSHGCTTSTSATMTSSNTTLIVNASVVSNVGCYGQSTGSALVAATGGMSPYSYSWSSGSSQSLASNLPAGSYIVTVSDINGCSGTASVVISQPTTPLSSSVTNVTNILCFGEQTGTATVLASGGTPPYNYYWNSVPAQATSTATNLSAGAYSVIVTDNSGCNDTAQVTIAQPAPLTISVNAVSNVTCYSGSDGTATISANGGTPPYSYSWSNSSQTGPTAMNLLAGAYSATVTDAHGCTTSIAINITEPQAINASISSSTNASCNGGANGSATVGVTGGVPPFSYAWNTVPAQLSATALNLGSGIYFVTVADANGCTDTAGITIQQPNNILVSLSVLNPFCIGGANGSASANVSGGTPPYSYSWNTVPSQTTATATSLTSGTYTVTVSDANGCTSTASATIAMPSTPLNASITNVSTILCHGSKNGTATVSVSGGTAPYNYFWNSNPFQVGMTATGLPAGNFIVTVTDNNGCSDTAHVTITQPSSPLNIQVNSIGHPTCHGGQNGNASISVTGGTAPYLYNWGISLNQTTSNVTGLVAGIYVVTVTDANGCTATQSITITQPTNLNGTITSQTDVLCFGGSNGAVSVTASGGAIPYTYSWNTNPVQNTAIASNLPAGQYTVTITDANGCSTTSVASISQPNILNASTTVSNLLCNGGNNGSATALVTGGVSPYSYSWSTVPVQTNALASNLGPGSYTVIVTDALGCTTNASATIGLPSLPITTSIGNTTQVSCFGQPTGTASVVTTGGTAPYSYFWNTTPVQTTSTATNLTAGTYTVIVTDNNGCGDTANVTITQPTSAVSATISNVVHPACHGGFTGSASVIPSGGVGPYAISWNTSPIQNSSSAINLTSGTYTVTVTDANGCTATLVITITQPDLLNVQITSIANVNCYGFNNGSATIYATGGVLPYSYSWNNLPGQSGPTVQGLAAGAYPVTVTDVNGCMATSTVSISQPTPLNAVVTTTDILCAGGMASASALTTGGIPPYTYTWNTNPIQTTATADSLVPGAYIVSISDASGCSTSASATISQPKPGIAATITAKSNVNCFDGSDGSALAAASGGATPYNYAWNTNPVQTTANATGLKAGTYTVTITDNNGCYDTSSVTIGQPNKINIATQVLSKTCVGTSEGSAKVDVDGGVAPYTVAWNGIPIQTADTIKGLSKGVYLVTVSDATGCTQSAVAVIENFPIFMIDAGEDQIICEGQSASLQVTRGVSFLWTPFSTLSCSDCANPVATPANTTAYKVVGSDINNCRDSDIVEVVVLHPQPITVGLSKTICEGDSVSLFAAGGAQYTWYPTFGLNDSHSATPIASPSSTTEYNVVIRQNKCYVDTLQQLVSVLPRPAIDLGPDQQGIAGSTLQINSQTSNANAIQWIPTTSLNCETCFNPIATLESSISYKAIVKNELGCTAEDEISIRVVCDNSVLFIANTFTPNGDGKNDVFYPQGRGVKIINSFKVYNRWGEIMFEANNFSPNDPSYGWDGSFKGLKLNPDAFVYIVNGICQNGDPVSMKGDVSLLR